MPAATSRPKDFSNARVVCLGVVAFLWLGLILARLAELQIFRHAEFSRRAERQQQRVIEFTPRRGVIYDRHGRELAMSIPVESAFAVPAEVTDPELAARLLAPVVGQEPTEIEQRLRSTRAFTWIARKLDAQQAEQIRALNLRGIYFQRESKRFYPKRELAAQVLGFVGLDENGLAGIEYALDKELRGPAGRLVIFTDGRKRWFQRVQDPPGEGASVVLTLDENIQFIAERALAAASARTRPLAGTIIVADPHTGEILALANWPIFNPNNYNQVPPSRHVNRAVTLAFEPGSTFKVVTVAAALEERLTQVEEKIYCQQGGIVLAGHLIRDHKPFGWLSVREIIQESSDVGAIKLGLRLGPEKLYEHIRHWGFGQRTGLGLPAESPGLLRPVESWSGISIGALAMGQEVAVTTLQLVAAMSVVANGGEWVQPRIVREILPAPLKHTQPPPPPGRRQRILHPETAEWLRVMLRGVVVEGTGVRAQPQGYTAAGKTGTAQKIDESGGYSPTEFVASFIGFAPAVEPVITIAVVLDSPRGFYHGGEVAAPVFRNVAEQVLAYLNVPPDGPILPAATHLRQQRAAVGDFTPQLFEATYWTTSTANSSPAFTPLREWGSYQAPTDAARIILTENESVEVPSLLGKSVRAVVEECARAGLEVVLVGSGVAVEQTPPAGTRLPRRSKLWVRFGHALTSRPHTM